MSGAVRCTLTREAILSLRAVSPELDQRTRMYVTSLGCACPRRGRRGGRAKRSADGHPLNIPVIIGNRRKRNPPITSRHPVLIAVKKSHLPVRDNNTLVHQSQSVPSLYVLNAAALTKSHAVEQLATDVANYQIDIAVITETHCKAKHTDSVLSIPGYTLQRRDRQRRRGGGVAVYVRSGLQSSVWTYSADDRVYELHWQRVGDLFLGAVYHPPRPLYTTDSLLNYIETCVDEINCQFPSATIVLAGDFNQLSDHVVAERTGLAQIVRQPTRGPNILDRIFVSRPAYSIVRVVSSVMRSDHRAIVAYAEQPSHVRKTTIVRTFRAVSPAQHSQFLRHMAVSEFNYSDDSTDTDTQGHFDVFYNAAL